VLSLLGEVPNSVAPGAAASDISFKLADQVDWGTAEPASDTMQLTAVLNSGGALQLKGTGENEQFASSMSFSFSDQGSNFWGLLEDIIFDTSEDDIGDYVLLTCTCDNPLQTGQTLTKLEIIPIIPANEYHCKIKTVATFTTPPPPSVPFTNYDWGYKTWVYADGDRWDAPFAYIYESMSQYLVKVHNLSGAGHTSVYGAYGWEEPTGANEGYYLGVVPGESYGTSIIHLHTPSGDDEYSNELFEIEVGLDNWQGNGGQVDWELEVYQGDSLQATYTKNTIVGVGGGILSEVWCKFDKTDGSVTMINP
jgi:hypothetical protein